MGKNNTDFLSAFEEHIFNYCKENKCVETTREEYADFSYPKFFKMMKFQTHQYSVEGFGKVMFMHTNAMGGLMNLLTVSFMPSTGIKMPYLLIDMMSMKKKKACFVEYYDCTGKKLSYDSLMAIKKKHESVSEYEEKQAWYVGERMPESLIKGGKVKGSDEASSMEKYLLDIARESFDAYMKLIGISETDPSCLDGLKAFKHRMQTEGNPSDSTMRTVLGEEGAKKFFDEYVMPL